MVVYEGLTDAPSGAPSGAPSDALSDAEIDRLFRALADATRRDIVRRTLRSSTTVSELAADYDMSFAAVQKHVAVLERAGLVSKAVHGRERHVSAEPARISHARELLARLEELWRARFDQIDDVLHDDRSDPTERPTEGTTESEDPPCPSPTSPRTPTS